MIKHFIPASLKLWYTINKRRCRDLFNGDHKKFTRQCNRQKELSAITTIAQAIRSTETTANKVHNLGLAINKLNDIVISPGQIFSFWKLVGNPSQKNGYKKSRAIIGNKLQEDVGGGLCQLSGLIYFLALHAGLTITERHAHSLDIYKEEERFTPLGSDATVAFGYKDLRLLNPYPFAVSLSFQLTAGLLKGTVSAAKKITPRTIEFKYKKNNDYTEVTTLTHISDKPVVLNKSSYSSFNI